MGSFPAARLPNSFFAGQHNLGVMYFNGYGVPRNLEEAYFWLNLASVAGDKISADLRDEIARTLTPEALAAAQKRAKEWKPQASVVKRQQ